MEIHVNEKFKKAIPALSPDEYAELEQSIISEGCRDAIVVWKDIIIDGHNRYEICQRHGIKFDTYPISFDNENQALIWIIKNQFARRNITPYTRSLLALKLEDIIAEKARERQACGQGGILLPHNCAEATDPIDTREELAKIAGVSHGTIHKVKAIEKNAPESIKVKARNGEISINQAYSEVKKDERKAEIESKRDELAAIGKDKIIEIDFRCGDFMEVLANIPDGSVDCIVTDPPYSKEYIEQWTRLSEFASRKLRKYGFCIAYSGQMYLPEVLARMGAHLDYYWTFAVYHEGNTQIVNGVNLMCRWKPVLIYQNGKHKVNNTFQDYFISHNREKEGHDWQQSLSGVSYLVEMFTDPCDLICDPFAGSGTTIKAALAKGRRIIAAEIDEKTYNIAKSQL